jgi:hypothetical protein
MSYEGKKSFLIHPFIFIRSAASREEESDIGHKLRKEICPTPSHSLLPYLTLPLSFFLFLTHISFWGAKNVESSERVKRQQKKLKEIFRERTWMQKLPSE